MIKTTKTIFDIIQFLQDKDGATLSEVTEEIGLSKSTTHTHLKSLRSAGYVVRDQGNYFLSMRFLDHGDYVRRRERGYEVASQKTNELAETTNERAQFMIEENGLAIYVAKATGKNAVPGDPGIGKPAHLHSTAGGKAILAFLPHEKSEEYIEKWKLPKLTDHTITDYGELMDELELIRENHFAVNREEALDHLYAVAVPIKNPDGSVLGALSISGPKNRMKGDRINKELPELLSGIANEIELTVVHGES